MRLAWEPHSEAPVSENKQNIMGLDCTEQAPMFPVGYSLKQEVGRKDPCTSSG